MVRREVFRDCTFITTVIVVCHETPQLASLFSCNLLRAVVCCTRYSVDVTSHVECSEVTGVPENIAIRSPRVIVQCLDETTNQIIN